MGCGHALTMSNLDGMMDMKEYYEEETDKRTGDVRYVAKKALPDGEVSQVPCHLCRKPIVDLFRYGRRIKYGQLSMRLKKHQLAQDKEMQGALQRLDVAQARMAQEADAFLTAIEKTPDEHRTGPPDAGQRVLGKFQKLGDPFPQAPLRTLNKVYGIPVADEVLWSKLIKDAVNRYQEFRNLNISNRRSPSKQLFDAAVSHLYRIKTTLTFDVASNTIIDPKEGSTPSEIIEACIKECGLPRNGHGGNAYVNSLHESTNVLVLILSQAFAVAGKKDIMSGWYWFVEDLLECTMVHAEMLMETAVNGKFERQAAFARLIQMDVRCKMVQLIGRTPIPTDKDEKRMRFKKVDDLTEQSMIDLEAINNSCPLGIKAECVQRANSLEEKMARAVRIARGEAPYSPLSYDEKVMLFRAMSSELRGSGHWYRCVNGHTYVIANCGMAMQASVCPECGARVGGGNHEMFAENTRDMEFEAMVGRH
ncbi:hypothetical protein BGX34_008994 [Mortierella sp. NVP85]|nr:hypothetical protein BGX34_008994 [Mortierella sp. NVP85]